MRLIAPIQQIRVNKRKQWIIAGGVVFGSLWLMLVFWLMTAEKTTVGPAPSQVAVRSASPTLSTTPTVNVQMPQYSPLKPISYSQPAYICPADAHEQRRDDDGLYDQQRQDEEHRRWRRFVGRLRRQ